MSWLCKRVCVWVNVHVIFIFHAVFIALNILLEQIRLVCFTMCWFQIWLLSALLCDMRRRDGEPWSFTNCPVYVSSAPLDSQNTLLNHPDKLLTHWTRNNSSGWVDVAWYGFAAQNLCTAINLHSPIVEIASEEHGNNSRLCEDKSVSLTYKSWCRTLKVHLQINLGLNCRFILHIFHVFYLHPCAHVFKNILSSFVS